MQKDIRTNLKEYKVLSSKNISHFSGSGLDTYCSARGFSTFAKSFDHAVENFILSTQAHSICGGIGQYKDSTYDYHRILNSDKYCQYKIIHHFFYCMEWRFEVDEIFCICRRKIS